MKHVVIGTAGHVDHGKTALVRALTGVDTDRLAEEKRRGLTIELGFARLDFPDGSCVGVVDVPGHEKFIKTMLAGAGGIDLAMLVVAADEGFMPQTVEHLNILSLLGVRRGVVVLTKCDLADADWLAMARAELAARVKGTFLENAPVVETSAATGQGIEDLREALHALVRQTREKSARVPFRLPIDRVFSVDGFGTVVTGTLIEGALHVGGEAELLPSGTRSRVRNLQVHGENTAIAVAGQRVAAVQQQGFIILHRLVGQARNLGKAHRAVLIFHHTVGIAGMDHGKGRGHAVLQNIFRRLLVFTRRQRHDRRQHHKAQQQTEYCLFLHPFLSSFPSDDRFYYNGFRKSFK